MIIYIRTIAKTLRVGLLSAAVCAAGGCGVELAMIGAAASAASSGAAVFKQGKLNASWMGPFDHVVAAGEVAAGELGLTIRSTTGDPVEGRWKTVLLTEDGEKIVIKIARKTPQLTEFQIDVGLSGSEATARLLLKRMAVAIDLDASQDGTGEVVPEFVPVPVPERTNPEPGTPQSEPPGLLPALPGERL
ncbi:MAG: DUF3568 family protein [Planctomycetota bacterium]